MIALLACSKKKRNFPVAASVLYTGALYTLCKRYCWLKYYDFRILSAKHGLLDPYEMVEPYNVTLVQMSSRARRIWAAKVNEQLAALNNDHWIVFASRPYREFLELPGQVEIPLEGLGYGQQVQRMKELVDEQLQLRSSGPRA